MNNFLLSIQRREAILHNNYYCTLPDTIFISGGGLAFIPTFLCAKLIQVFQLSFSRTPRRVVPYIVAGSFQLRKVPCLF